MRRAALDRATSSLPSEAVQLPEQADSRGFIGVVSELTWMI
jgi:hypothetical protein